MYTNSRCCVWTKDGYSDRFDILTGVRQGCILSPSLFLIVMDYIMRKSMSNPQYGISWSPGRLTDLDFADDIVKLLDSHAIMQHMTDDLNTNAAKVGWTLAVRRRRLYLLGNHLPRQFQLAQLTPECWKFPVLWQLHLQPVWYWS